MFKPPKEEQENVTISYINSYFILFIYLPSNLEKTTQLERKYRLKPFYFINMEVYTAKKSTT